MIMLNYYKWSESHLVVSDSLGPHELYIVHAILQARILEWVAYPFSSRSSWPRNWSGISYIAGRFFTNWAMMEGLHKYNIDFEYKFLRVGTCLYISIPLSIPIELSGTE